MKILIHRKDNIGDTVLSLPFIGRVSKIWPHAEITYWGPDYVASIFDHYVGEVSYVGYPKSKHANRWFGKFTGVLSKLKNMIHLRHKNFDLLFFLGDGTSPYARQVQLLIAPKKLISFFPSEREAQLKDEKTRFLLIGSPIHNRQPEFLEIMKILNPFSKSNLVEADDPPFLRVPEEKKRELRDDLGLFRRQLIGIHLSARRPKQRWPLEYFEELTKLLSEQHPSVGILITWSPGDTSNVEHPGDDLASVRLKKMLDGIELIRFCPTESLGDLLRVQSICNVVFCADGGAMHTAAALGIRVVAIFGDSNPIRWRPIGDGHIILVSESRDVADISVNQVHRAISSVLDHAYD